MDLLIKKAQKGDEQAFIQAIDECLPQMYKVAKTRLKNEEDIGDAIQETILACFKNIKKLKNPCFFKTWLIKILINKCNDILGSNKIIYVDDFSEVMDHSVDMKVEDIIEEKLDFESVLSILNPDYRLVIVLYYVNRFNIKEISEILNEKEGTIKSRLSRARQQLKIHYVKSESESFSNGGC
jgi:RNA polymerase sigma factor (sigma-70 family)